MRKMELLSPAGDMERLQYAVRYGADAVYLAGKQFGMRAAPSNFDEEEMRQAVAFAHKNGAKVYVTCNTLPTNREIDALPPFLHGVREAGADALIVADMGVLSLCRREVPDMEIHMSTQTGIVNYAAANELYRLGAKRIVLARELSLPEIKTIREKTPEDLELEVFVHGAMCVSFSGRCLLSSYIMGRSANRGQCAQPCRWGYHLMEEKRPGEYYPVYEDEKGTYILNAKDLCMIEYLDKLYEAGVDSLKIEGRAKSFYYVAACTGAYRQAIDLFGKDPDHYDCPQWIRDEVRKVSHRDYSTGFFFSDDPPGQCYENGGYVRTCDVVATVDRCGDGRIFCTQRGKFSAGDTIEIMAPGMKPIPWKTEHLWNEEGEEIESVPHPMMRFSMMFDRELPEGTILRKEK